MTTNRPLRVFLCHSSNDKPAVRELYQKLRNETWLEPWLDEEELYPGHDWNLEIEKAAEAADAIIVCLSKNSINKEGYVQRELRIVLDAADYKPEGTLYIIPVRLEECEPPRRLRAWQYADYFEGQRERALERLLVSLKRRADSLGLDTRTSETEIETKPDSKQAHKVIKEEKSRIKKQHSKPAKDLSSPININSNSIVKEVVNPSSVNKSIDKKRVVAKKLDTNRLEIPTPKWIAANKIIVSNGMEFMRVPAGKFLMGGSDRGENDEYEISQHTVDISHDYWMAHYLVTNEQYNIYIKSKGINNPVHLWERKKDHPVSGVEWIEALEYCQWLNSLLKAELPSGLVLRLPTEAEWEKAARGTDGWEYPWGNNFDKNRCNTYEGGKGGTTPVGFYSPLGDSPYGCADMAGNIWEWNHSLMKAYPYNIKDGREDEKVSGYRVLRGGSFDYDGMFARCAYRGDYDPPLNSRGFRVVASHVFS